MAELLLARVASSYQRNVLRRLFEAMRAAGIAHGRTLCSRAEGAEALIPQQGMLVGAPAIRLFWGADGRREGSTAGPSPPALVDLRYEWQMGRPGARKRAFDKLHRAFALGRRRFSNTASVAAHSRSSPTRRSGIACIFPLDWSSWIRFATVLVSRVLGGS